MTEADYVLFFFYERLAWKIDVKDLRVAYYHGLNLANQQTTQSFFGLEVVNRKKHKWYQKTTKNWVQISIPSFICCVTWGSQLLSLSHEGPSFLPQDYCEGYIRKSTEKHFVNL